MRLGDTTASVGMPSNGTWAGPRSALNSNGGPNGNTQVLATSAGTMSLAPPATPAVVVAPVVVKPAINKALLYVGGALLLWMILKNRKA